MRFLILIAAVLAMTACSSGDTAMTKAQDMKTRCLRGVEYYIFREIAGNAGFGYMSPVYVRRGNTSVRQLCTTNQVQDDVSEAQ